MFPSQALYFSIAFSVLNINLCLINVVNTNEVDEPTPIDVKKPKATIEVLNYKPMQIPYGENVTIVCKTYLSKSSMWWSFQDRNITNDDGYIMEIESDNIHSDGEKLAASILHILDVDLYKIGEYACHAENDYDEPDEATILLNVTFPATTTVPSPVRVNLHKSAELSCYVKGYPLDDVKWYKASDTPNANDQSINGNVTERTALTLNISFTIDEVSRKDNGTYVCSARVGNVIANSSTAILVLDKPQVSIDFVKAIGTNKIYLNWTVNDGNERSSLTYQVQYKKPDDMWYYYPEKIGGGNHSYILRNVFDNNTDYVLRLMAKNYQGDSAYSTTNTIRTLSSEPAFIPDVKVTGMTVSSITITWTTPPVDMKDHVHYYQLSAQAENSSVPFDAMHSASEMNIYLFTELHAATNYKFRVAACSDYSKQCGSSSNEVNGTTMDGISGPPENVSVTCRFDNISHASFVFISWSQPKHPNGNITHYNVNLEGNASFINDQGLIETTSWGPKMISVKAKSDGIVSSTRVDNVSANTNYTVRVSGVTRTKKQGEPVSMSCTMPPTIPSKQPLSRFSWGKVEEQGHWMFKLFLPRVSERNGPICCYRIYIVKMETHQGLAELPTPEDIPVISYQEAHRTPKGGAYVAEMFTSNTFHPEIFLGDEKVFNISNSPCDHCIGLRPYSTPREHLNNSVLFNARKRRNQIPLSDPLPPYDGSLDINSNYTSFVEIIVHGERKGQTLAAYSNYLMMMSPGPEVLAAPEGNVLSLVIHVLCGLVALAFLLLTALCLLHRYTKQAHQQAVEMITFRTSFRHLCRSLRGRQRLVSLNPPDMCPIAKTDLLSSYIERHRDSDYGFQQEFELLPDKFSDRTTRASDTRENLLKNRYPDIKAYDQTRVRLAQIDSIAGSDYINANFVLGYKERKKFICAQGPMDTTVNEYWRMIWEQHLELILMLTNLEEYSKTKCAKYWPDKTEGEKTFGDITVAHIQETRYSDYIIRELRVCKTGTNRDVEERCITQYHYLVWKDFMAPEHPHGIIKFIKRMNEAYSLERGCILIHCSAGVGRTGTLVALDCLLQQLRDEGHVAIFNSICDLRHQRNFLVQSLKQYIFVYRALVEVAQYGDTEISTSELKATVDRLRQCDKDKTQTKLEEEFDNIKNAFEDRKSSAVAGGEENRERNRSDSVLPYDRNRVILTPLPSKDHSTYINASFLEGYDNSESFIITQDPMETTIADFWRMISEQGISVIVMLSELGDFTKKCPRYWPEDEAAYEHITVRYVQAESCPYYTRREMYVRCRDGEDLRVVHLQYHGWPTVDGEVPEVTRGLIELVDHAQSCLSQEGQSTPMVVHCGLGSDRSSLFVGLSILVQQLRMERRVDIFTATRKLRSQRQGLVNTYAQYEFLHRAIVNYAELHNLCDT